MAADGQPLPVDDPERVERIDRGVEVVAQVIDVVIVGGLAVLAEDRRVGLDDGVSLDRQEGEGARAVGGEAMSRRPAGATGEPRS